ncbi:MAG: M14 family zinc carboxypeptidase [candidate division WOR-3 bacterium]
MRMFIIIFTIVFMSFGLANSYETELKQMPVPERLDLVKIDITNHSQVKSLDAMGIIINQVRDNYVVAEVKPEMISYLRKIGYQVSVLQQDISGFYYHNFITRSDRGRYLTYTEFVDTMNVIANNHPEICKLETLGFSHNNRLILAMKISDTVWIDEKEPAVYFDGNIHGDEKIGWAICFELIKYIVQNYYDNAFVYDLVNSREIWIVPMINPDGYVNSVRYNGRNVDLNRNFGWMWGNESNCGSDAFSENEATAFYNLFIKQPFVIYTTYHAGDSVISNPWSYTTYDSVPEKFLIWHLAQGYSQSGNYYPYGQGSIIMYLINGSSKDYCYGIGGEVSWSIEVCNTKTPPASWIDPCFNSNRNAMLYLIRKAGQGVHGTVTDSITGEPLYAQIWMQPRNWLSYTSPTNGDFHRFYLPGSYTMIVKCAGYKQETLSVVIPNNTQDSAITLDIKLMPDPLAVQNYGMRVIHNRYVTTSSNRTYPVRALGIHDGVSFQLDNTKWIVIEMAKPIQNKPDYDFTIYRTGTSGSATIKIANNWKGPWTTIGSANSAVSHFDINSSGLDTVRYVRLEAAATFNLDAIEDYAPVPAIEYYNNQLINQSLPIIISPTIASSYLKITCNANFDKDRKFTIYDALGRNLKSFYLPQNQNYIVVDLKDNDNQLLANGIYFVKADKNDRPIIKFTIIK